MNEVDKNLLEKLFNLPKNSINEIKSCFDGEGNFIVKMGLKTAFTSSSSSFKESSHYIDNLILNNQI